MAAQGRLQWLLVAVPVLIGAAVVWVVVAPGNASVGLSQAELAAPVIELPEGLDAAVSLDEASRQIEACGAGCAHALFVWTPRMPLSRAAIPNLEAAAKRVDATVVLLRFEDLERAAEEGTADPAVLAFADGLLGAGALAHAPSLTVYRGGGALGRAVMGYKSEEAYTSILAERLADGPVASASPSDPDRASLSAGGVLATAVPPDVSLPSDLVAYTDYAAVGVPGAYFKWVPGRRALAYESNRRIYLLNLEDGESRLGPGYVDFIPDPLGRYFVTPLQRNAGLGFYDADQIFSVSWEGRANEVRPVFVDTEMTDQYPSVGVLEQTEASVRYRILTSWFEGLVYRDYEVTHASAEGAARVEPLGPLVIPCRGMGLSTPIMSQDGREVAARDEGTGTTKIFRILEAGRCEEVVDLGVPTRKVAWHAGGPEAGILHPSGASG